MSSDDFNHLFDHLQEQICYVQCGYCTTLLLVSVPCKSLSSSIVTVRCGHCTTLLSVNIMNIIKSSSSFLPPNFHFFASLNHHDHDYQPLQLKKEVLGEDEDKKIWEKQSPSLVMSSDEEDEDVPPINQVLNKPPKKKQRAPSAYNYFIREEIRRLKAAYPKMSHKQAFSRAAKNWAHFPPYQREEEGQNIQREKNVVLI
ncbi:hypothetical protein M9H77_10169 [Catharanthus roseus]|uniref:Uncharacterized protein n=1 Tax=Catharanthus roseus TaxID=4058 RepID=A0ACC0C2Q7_CATRO|nr:hypothetical protein M9H77_10169 [Catharanthus roseus]